ncbi:aldo/keto reductase [Roseicyclus sp.]|uniref:aldo/keto reductase n=1 Tax=Roseicyclus sp. TaxID=1914329 RepID=UPI003FA1011A
MDATTRIPLHTGRHMPVIGLGTWKLAENTADAVLAALDAGCRMIDTAVDYGSQKGIGEGLARCDLDRDAVFVVTKIEEDDDPLDAMERDLSELGLDHADLTLIHRPPPEGAGEALWRGLIAAQRDGLVRDIGVSNYAAPMLDALAEATGVLPVVNQVEWTPFGHAPDLLEHHRARGIVLQAYSPLTRGELLDDPRLAEIAEAQGRTPAQVILRWNLQRRTVPLPKAGDIGHVRENFDVFDFELPEDAMRRLDGLERHHSALGGLAYV